MGKKVEKAAGSPQQEGKQIRLTWGLENLNTVYVNHMSIMHAGSEFFVTFGELTPPIVKDAKQLPEELPITPKVRLAVTEKNMEAFIRVLNQNYQKVIGGKKE